LIKKEFLREVLSNEELRRSELLSCFLLWSDQKAFEEGKKVLEAGLPKRDFRSIASRRNLEFNGNDILELDKLQTIRSKVSS
jgi:hypothetical protein